MAAVTSVSLFRNCAATTVRAFVTGKASNPNFTTFLLPLQSRRSLCRVSATNDEEAAAKVATANANSGAPTIFDKIIAKEIPSSIVYEDDKVLAFRDINPQAPVHAELRHVEILGQLLHAAKIVAEIEGILDGFRVVINNGPEACQSVYHLHLHVLGGRQMKWPPG
ncbi:14 kDa zinc-binding protein [Prunus yedoensis var. nudiflora]|uniref:14 kDa zinc-binding protein n=1 Tax=Prunus yedoensis var. nudiflora TaxID=2094558 RepID=A0A314Z0N3_PRUYE|nr:14 kDa zinc-binding protein [Prunus yedoensis var. nudiflora]